VLRRLDPDSAPVSALDAFADVDFNELAPPDRPYLVVNMVASADGHATVEGRTEGLSGEADRDVFHTLRTMVDAVMVGTGTLRAERYGRMARSPERQAQRRARGLHPEPYALVCSRRGDFPDDIPLFTDPEARLLTYDHEDAALPSRALRRAREEHGVRSVLCEGGPTLNAALLAEGVVDELFLTISPLLANGPAPLTIVEAAGPGEPVPLELVWVLEGDGMLFLRYAVARAG
jgi:riboflavin biosynthesis pyrimidine reductase